MDHVGFEKIIAAVGAAIAAVLTPLGVIYTAILTRRNQATETRISNLNEDICHIEKELEQLKLEAELHKKHSLRWYQLTMFWFNKAHEMRREALDARQKAESLVANRRSNHIEWPDELDLPEMEQPIP
jgi:hypothetical protein